MKSFFIGDSCIGDQYPMFIIAEIGVSAGKSLEDAFKLIDSAVESGANAVKFQTFSPKLFVSQNGDLANHFKGEDIISVYKRMEFPRKFYDEVNLYCKKKEIIFFTSIFDINSLKFVEKFDLPAFKIAAFEIGNSWLLEAVAETKKTMILSTGMCNLSDVERAINIIEKKNNSNIILLHTVSSYPAGPEDYNLKVIQNLKSCFGYPVGVSDHTKGLDVPIVATALGSNVIEKHITLSNTGPHADDFFALEPLELKKMVKKIKVVEKILGDGRKKIKKSENSLKSKLRLSIIAKKDLEKGERIKESNIEIKRSGSGIEPQYLEIILYSKLIKSIKKDHPIEWTSIIKR